MIYKQLLKIRFPFVKTYTLTRVQKHASTPTYTCIYTDKQSHTHAHTDKKNTKIYIRTREHTKTFLTIQHVQVWRNHKSQLAGPLGYGRA